MTSRPRAKKIALWIVAITLALIALLLSRCVSLESYEYLSFEGVKEAKVTQWSNQPVPDIRLKHPAPIEDVWLKHPVPLEYEIVRDRYRIRLRLPYSENGKEAFIALTGGAYTLEGPYIHKLDMPNWKYPGYEYNFDPPIEWEGRRAKVTVFSLRFTVFDKNGKPVAQEDIPFEEKTGGWYIAIDAL